MEKATELCSIQWKNMIFFFVNSLEHCKRVAKSSGTGGKQISLDIGSATHFSELSTPYISISF